jgi:hypothetical protein
MLEYSQSGIASCLPTTTNNQYWSQQYQNYNNAYSNIYNNNYNNSQYYYNNQSVTKTYGYNNDNLLYQSPIQKQEYKQSIYQNYSNQVDNSQNDGSFKHPSYNDQYKTSNSNKRLCENGLDQEGLLLILFEYFPNLIYF